MGSGSAFQKKLWNPNAELLFDTLRLLPDFFAGLLELTNIT